MMHFLLILTFNKFVLPALGVTWSHDGFKFTFIFGRVEKAENWPIFDTVVRAATLLLTASAVTSQARFKKGTPRAISLACRCI
jgi:hypothetical protein